MITHKYNQRHSHCIRQSVIRFCIALVVLCCVFLFSFTEQSLYLIPAAIAVYIRNNYALFTKTDLDIKEPLPYMVYSAGNRLSEVVIYIAVGYASLSVFGVFLGFIVALLSVITAYRHILCCILTQGSFVSVSINSKQQCMSLLSLSLLLTVIEYGVWQTSYALIVSMLIITAMSLVHNWSGIHGTYKKLYAASK